VAFSPQDEVNDDIIQTFGFGVISDVLADPRFLSSSDDYYPGLRSIAKEYFEKYSQGNIYDYLRLIKYFDNSIFKAIKNYVPARTSVSTGIVIKQHLLERNRVRPVQLSEVTKIAVTPEGGYNTPIVRENLELTSSIEVGSFSGGTGGVLEDFNNDNLNYEVGFLSQTLNLSSNITTNTITGPVDGTYTNIEGNFPSPPSEPFFTIIVSGGVITSIILTGLNFPTTQWVGDEVMRVEGTDFNQGGGFIIITLTESDITYQPLQICSGVHETVLGDVPYSDVNTSFIL
jgi:hypothetical protein